MTRNPDIKMFQDLEERIKKLERQNRKLAKRIKQLEETPKVVYSGGVKD